MNAALGFAVGGLGVIAGVVLARNVLFDRRSKEVIESMERSMAPRPDRRITEADLKGLPEPVQRYLHYAGVVGKLPIRRIRAHQSGQLRFGPTGRWMPFEAEEVYSAAPPGFVWQAKVKTAPFLPVKVRDQYLYGRGHIEGRVGGALTVVDTAGMEIDQGTALRFLNEMVFFPTAFLEEYIRWEAIDDTSARVFMKHWPREVTAICHFAPDGRMVDFVAHRFMGMGKKSELTEWRTPFGEYFEADGFLVPKRGSAIWRLESGDFEYIRIQADSLSYDGPSPSREVAPRKKSIPGRREATT